MKKENTKSETKTKPTSITQGARRGGREKRRRKEREIYLRTKAIEPGEGIRGSTP